MSGVYVHIPFCKQACHYCDFHFSTNLKKVNQVAKSLVKEISLKADRLPADLDTIYLGGGTPSILDPLAIANILETISSSTRLSPNAEITIEVNPDDITAEGLTAYQDMGINRLSIGVQSFDESRLKYVNRAHNVAEALSSIELAKLAGFNNFSIDLIYAIPPEEMSYWKRDLQTVMELEIPHISLYGLTIEEKTVFGRWQRAKKLAEVSEEMSERQYRLAIDWLTQKGYRHYEVSNFALPGHESKHNGAYWRQKPYVGIGPGAHSYNGENRWANVRSNQRYIDSINQGTIPEEVEQLSATQLTNEYILTRLRTFEGIDLNDLTIKYQVNLIADKGSDIEVFLGEGLLARKDDRLVLTQDGLMLADEIALQLFYDE
ncbi:MAG: radical SAM family heme chaperone HemW [Cyclobacteriaceae bacterium]|nr:radical SAM family heme chaperone HemW [Cyclobacteriaceae bacterium HetDA_MAG_MS6]